MCQSCSTIRPPRACTVRDGRIAGYDVIADPVRLRDLDLAVLGEAAENYGGRRRGRA